MYTIFINDKPFIITDDWDYFINDASYLHYYNDDLLTINKIAHDFIGNKANKGLVLHASNAVKAFETFCTNYELIEAAGGIVENELDEVLLIYRKGRWDLPKGKMEVGETEMIAAKREVMEECGLTAVEVKAKLITTYHTFFLPQKNVMKISHWYMMSSSSTEKIKPQLEEDITDIKWFGRATLDIEKLDTYPSIYNVLQLYLKNK